MLSLGTSPLDDPIKERWLQFCELAAKEQDPVKLLEFVQDINRLLEEREFRVKTKHASRAHFQVAKRNRRAAPIVFRAQHSSR